MNLPIKIILPDRFLNEEERSGYVVSEKLKKIWAIELDLLSELDRICKKYDIKYFAFAGTLLGAIRHHGFIPWDDDLDVAMSRRDFRRLCAIAKHECHDPYFFQTALSDRKYYMPYARLRNSMTTACVHGNESANYNNGIYIDIHPLDGRSNYRIVEKIHRALMLITRKFCTTYFCSGSTKGLNSKIISTVLFPIVRILPYGFWVALHNMTNAMITRFSTIVDLRTHFDFGLKYWMLKKDMKDVMLVPYETITIPVPKNSDAILRNIYGNYLEFPPPSERGKWHEGVIHFDPEIPYKEYFGKMNSKQ